MSSYIDTLLKSYCILPEEKDDFTRLNKKKDKGFSLHSQPINDYITASYLQMYTYDATVGL